jgi:hypothetical protein
MQMLRVSVVAAVAFSGSEAGQLSHLRAKPKTSAELSSGKDHVASEGPFDWLTQDVAEIMGENPLDILKKEAGDLFKKGKERIKKPIMGSISRFRLMMCHGRPNLLSHEACMKFMTEKCMEKSTGEGGCEKYKNYLIDNCKDGSEVACDHATRMGLDVGGKKEEKVEEEEKQEEEKVEEEEKQEPQNVTNITQAAAPNSSIPANRSNVSEEVVVVVNATESATGIDKKLRGLPEAGFNEYGNGTVLHTNTTGTQDWLDERPHPRVETDDEAKYRTCKAQSEETLSLWCKLFIKRFEGSNMHSFAGMLSPSSLALLVAFLSPVGTLFL